MSKFELNNFWMEEEVTMAELQEIKKRILLENDVFTEWQDDLYENTALCVKKIAVTMMSSGGLQALEDFSNGNIPSGQNPLKVNTYPIGEPTNRIYPEFLGVYSSRTQRSMTGLFNAVKKQLGHYKSREFSKVKKSITILTDTWNPMCFQKNEALFLNAILDDDVRFNFYLVTDYGITRIPFMNRRQTDDFRREYLGQHIDEEDRLQEFVRETGLREMEYIVEQYESWLPSESCQHCRYDFDFVNQKYVFFDETTGEKTIGKTDSRHVMRFLRAAVALKQAGGIDNSVRATGGIERNVDFYQFSFHWYDGTGAEEMPEFMNMRNALEDMIKSSK
jgi:hypothetical protein